MIRKARKLIALLRAKCKYPNVAYFAAPGFLKLFGFDCRPGRKGFFSQKGQDEIIFTEFFTHLNSPRFPKIFLDVGCNHPVVHSNSYFFETNQGFRVVAVDALTEARGWWTKLRPAAEFVECAVGASDGEAKFDVIEGSGTESMFSSVTGASQKRNGGKASRRNVKVRRLKDILAERSVSEIGIVGMDIEGYEYEALLGMDLRGLRAWILIIENNANDGLGSDRIRDLLIANGYCYYARIWNLDDVFVHGDLLKSQDVFSSDEANQHEHESGPARSGRAGQPDAAAVERKDGIDPSIIVEKTVH